MAATRKRKTKCNCVQFYTHSDFPKIFKKALRTAYARILIQTPFLAIDRLEYFREDIVACVARGVRICVFVQQPWDWHARNNTSMKKSRREWLLALEKAINWLRALGVHVNLRPGIHEKAIVVDESHFWSGSLNILSFTDSTSEVMFGWTRHDWLRFCVEAFKLNLCDECNSHPLYQMYSRASFRTAKSADIRAAKIRMVVASRIKLARNRQDLTQEDLAKKVGLGVGCIADVEKGVDTSFKHLNLICAGLGMALQVVPVFFLPKLEQFYCRGCHKAVSKTFNTICSIQHRHTDTVGNRIALQREFFELTQRQLAERTVTRQATVSRLESATSDLMVSSIQRICGGLDLVLFPLEFALQGLDDYWDSVRRSIEKSAA